MVMAQLRSPPARTARPSIQSMMTYSPIVYSISPASATRHKLEGGLEWSASDHHSAIHVAVRVYLRHSPLNVHGGSPMGIAQLRVHRQVLPTTTNRLPLRAKAKQCLRLRPRKDLCRQHNKKVIRQSGNQLARRRNQSHQLRPCVRRPRQADGGQLQAHIIPKKNNRVRQRKSRQLRRLSV